MVMRCYSAGDATQNSARWLASSASTGSLTRRSVDSIVLLMGGSRPSKSEQLRPISPPAGESSEELIPMSRVLVVDDDSATRKMLCEVLALEGFATLTAADGQEALEILWKSEEPLVALLDYMMPRMTGV